VNEAGFFGSSFRVGRIQGIDVKVHVLFIIWIAFGLLNASDRAVVLLGDIVLFGSVLLHELGHCRGARMVGGDAHEIVLWPLGGLSMIRTPSTARAELISTGAGPLVNLMLALVGLGLVAADGGARPLLGLLRDGDVGLNLHVLQRLWWPEMTALGRIALMLAAWNFFLLLFNIIPAYPMDGGRLLRSLLWPFLGWRRATIGATVTALVFGGLFVAVGAVGWPPSAHGVGSDPFLILIGVMVLLASWQELQRARLSGGWQDRLRG
jgi:Zn-dependent protease